MTVIAAIEPAVLTVEPGGTVTATIRVRNQGSVVDQFDLSVLGDAQSWATIEPANLRLFPRTEGEAILTFAPPRASTPAAGPYSFGILARSVAAPDVSVAEEGTVTVGPFVALTSELRPRTSRGWRTGRHAVQVRNAGNVATTVAAKAIDPDDQLQLAVAPTTAEVGAGATTELSASARIGSWHVVGAPKRRPFTVEVGAATGKPDSIPAVFEQRAIVPGWLVPFVGVLIALIAAGFATGVLPPGGGGGTGGGPTAAPTQRQGEPTSAPVAGTQVADTPGASTLAADTPPPVTPEPTKGIYFTITGGSPVDGKYNAEHQQAIRSAGELDIFLRYLINGGFCYVELITSETAVPATYTYPDAARAHFSCDAPGSPAFSAVTGELVLDQFGSTVTGSFDFFADTDPNVNLYGIFRDIVVE